MPRILHAAILTVLACASLTSIGAGCSDGCGARNPTPTASERPALRAGKTVFQFDHETVTDALIVKSDPLTSDHWTARIHRPDARSTEWEVFSEGDAHPPLDRKADGPFILHLLDTMRTFHVTETPIAGPDTSLGLVPPRFAIQWKAAPLPGDPQVEHELRVGAPARIAGSVFAWIPGYPAFSATGATLQMLEYLKSFEMLRLKTWAGLTSDDVDEIELTKAGKPIYYAQREGSGWANRARKPIHTDLGPWLDRLTRSRVLTFIDDPLEAQKIAAQVKANPLSEATLKDRQGKATRLWIGAASGKIVGLSSARPQGVFEIYPTARLALDKPNGNP